MKKYIGVKIIHAEPQEAPKQYGEYPAGSAGFKVVYEDGYTSWSPLNVFIDAYRRIDKMTFGLAIEAMKKGRKVKLSDWEDGSYVAIQFPDEDSKMSAPYFYISGRFGLVPWVPTFGEMFAEDWMIIE